jgi:type IV pilus assembly protein PilV
MREPSAMNKKTRSRSISGMSGLSLIELMIAMTVLAVGLVGTLALILSAIASNTRNKFDTSATFLAQAVMEQILQQPGATNPTLSLTDCAGNTFSINTTGATGVGAGALLYTSGTAPTASLVDTINFTQARTAVPTGYQMQFVTCNSNGVSATYDVRWNIVKLDYPSAALSVIKLVTVSARQAGATTNIKLFAPPVTLRSVGGQP